MDISYGNMCRSFGDFELNKKPRNLIRRNDDFEIQPELVVLVIYLCHFLLLNNRYYCLVVVLDLLFHIFLINYMLVYLLFDVK